MVENLLHSGLVCLTGKPNSGKSTLLNRIAGMHLAITSPKPQTTRQVIRAILDEPDSQIIFLDTPGLHKPRSRLGQYMMNSTNAAQSDADVLVLMTDVTAMAVGEGRSLPVPVFELNWLKKAGEWHKPIILALNKIDCLEKERLLPVIAAYAAVYPFRAIIPVSARTGDGLEQLLDEIRRLLPAGPRYYPADSLTDQTERSMAAELIREQILLLTSDEIPHGVAVEIETFEELPAGGTAIRVDEDDADFTDDQDGDIHETTGETADLAEEERGLIRISAVLYCEKDSHKGILIGRQGSMLKRIGTQARLRIEQMTGCPCYLKLFIKVREDWRNRQNILRDLGYEIKP
ncbi:MAG: GTPase Era [Clostridiaceae bacterium]|nr:GTPase Era [Clostridiaceae bacterium]